MKSQTGAKYLHRRRNRKDSSYQGAINLTNHVRTSQVKRVSCNAVKRVKSLEV